MKLIFVILVMFSFNNLAFAETPKLKTKDGYENDSYEICVKEWTKRGELNRRMYNYCMEQQMKAYYKLKELHFYADQSFYSDIAYPYCMKDWSKRGVVNTRMLVYCLEQEVEGIKDVMYYRKQYGEESVNKIAGLALETYGSWRMAAYSVEQAFE